MNPETINICSAGVSAMAKRQLRQLVSARQPAGKTAATFPTCAQLQLLVHLNPLSPRSNSLLG